MQDFIFADTHCHIDLSKDPNKTMRYFDKYNIAVIAVTTTPTAYNQNVTWSKNYSMIKPALGLHPQLINTKHFDFDQFIALLPEANYIGEIGLDKSKDYLNFFDEQLFYFKKIIKEISKYDDKVLSIHSLKALKETFINIEEFIIKTNNKCILHWFTGTSKDLIKANELKCYFSINHKMLYLNNSKELIKNIPINKILLESDAPFICEKLSKNYYDSLITQISFLRSQPKEYVANAVYENSREIFKK